MHRSVRALARGLALIHDLNVNGPSSAQQHTTTPRSASIGGRTFGVAAAFIRRATLANPRSF